MAITKGDFVKDTCNNEWYVVSAYTKIILLMNLFTGEHWHASIYEPLTVIPTTSNHILRLQACHQRRVGTLLNKIASNLNNRAIYHDASKWQDAELVPLLFIADQYNRVEYNSPAYHSLRKLIAPAIEHHEKGNRHHLGHFNNDISKMNLLDIIEMLADWKAASEKNGGDVYNALERTAEQYKWPKELISILQNTLPFLS